MSAIFVAKSYGNTPYRNKGPTTQTQSYVRNMNLN